MASRASPVVALSTRRLLTFLLQVNGAGIHAQHLGGDLGDGVQRVLQLPGSRQRGADLAQRAQLGGLLFQA